MIAQTPDAPYVAVIFTSRRTKEDDAVYASAAARMEQLAAGQPGYLGIESVRDNDTGIGVTVSYWATEADAAAWKVVTEHVETQRRGIESWYDAYRVRVATVTRCYGRVLPRTEPDPGAGPPPAPPRDLALSIRRASEGDVDDVLRLWESAGAEPSHTDDVAGLRQLVAHDGAALLVAEHRGQLIGSVIAGWDGWRGSVYRLAVAPAYRRHGVGRALLAAAETRLEQVGARRSQAIVVSDGEPARSFWATSNWQLQEDRVRFVLG